MVKGKTTLERVKKLPTDSILEEGDQWFAVATPWWEEFQACQPAENAPSVRNEALIDKHFSSKDRKVAVLKPELEEGSDFVFVPEAAWQVISCELDFDWEIRRQVIYERSQQQLQIEPYPYAFKIFHWMNDQAEPEELGDDLSRLVVVLGSRIHTVGHLLAEVWLAAPGSFRRCFPQFVGGFASVAALSVTPKAAKSSTQTRVCYRYVRATDSESTWTAIGRLVKRRRTLLQLKPRASKRQACDTGKLESDQEVDDDEQSETEFDESGDQLKGDPTGLREIGDIKLGDLRLDDRSEIASGAARLHELLVEQRPFLAGQNAELGWPSQGNELRWRLGLSRGDELDALDTTSRWFEGRVIAARRKKVYVHYRGWDNKWDEWLFRTSPRLAPPHSRVAQWRENLQANASVQVGLQAPGLRHTKWRNATVLDVVPSSEQEEKEGDTGNGKLRLRVHVQVDRDDFWLPAQDDLLCQPSTHNISKSLTPRERRLLANDETLAAEVGGEASESEEDPDEVVDNDDEDDSDTDDPLDTEGDSSPPSRPPSAINVATEVTPTRQTRTELRTGLGPALNLNDVFDRIRGQIGPHATQAPTPSRQTRTHVPADNRSTAHAEFQTLWVQISDELQANWTRLGHGIMAFVEATRGPHPYDESRENGYTNSQE